MRREPYYAGSCPCNLLGTTSTRSVTAARKWTEQSDKPARCQSRACPNVCMYKAAMHASIHAPDRSFHGRAWAPQPQRHNEKNTCCRHCGADSGLLALATNVMAKRIKARYVHRPSNSASHASPASSTAAQHRRAIEHRSEERPETGTRTHPAVQKNPGRADTRSSANTIGFIHHKQAAFDFNRRLW